jgi:hypothetical protein
MAFGASSRRCFDGSTTMLLPPIAWVPETSLERPVPAWAAFRESHVPQRAKKSIGDLMCSEDTSMRPNPSTCAGLGKTK